MTQTDFINLKIAAQAKKNQSDMIRDLIQEDITSPQKGRMREGKLYYRGQHDILKKDFRSTYLSETISTAQGEREEVQQFQNPNRSNHHNVNAFHRVLVDQKASYLVSREPSISVNGSEKDKVLKDYETMLTDFADDTFNEMLQELVTNTSNEGFAALHVYYDEKGDLKYCVVPAEEMIPIYDTEHEKELKEVIRYYSTVFIRNGEKHLRKRVEWWTEKDITYYVEDEKNNFLLDTSYTMNPKPHWCDIFSINGAIEHQENHSWGRVPFIILKNNPDATTDLEPIKGLIDAYDLISSEGTNDFLDLVGMYWAIMGYGGESASAIARKLKVNKAVNISDSSGSIEAKQTDIPTAGRIEFLKMLRRDIFHFGMGIDIDNEQFGSAPSGVSLKFRYAQLDLKAGKMAASLRKVIKELLWYVTEDYNRKNGSSYDSSQIRVAINQAIVTNDLETVQMIQASEGIVSEKTLLAKHPFVADVNEELKELETQKQKELEKADNFAGVFPLKEGKAVNEE